MKSHLQTLIKVAVEQLQQLGKLPTDIPLNIQIERSRDTAHGDFASNIALMLAKPSKAKPRDLAEMIIQHLPGSEQLDHAEIAGPGFINFFLATSAKTQVLQTIFKQAAQFGHQQITQKQSLHIEFVSANPTGPLHVGHGRHAAYGAVVANLLEMVGYQVYREYYVNDAGRQMNILATSIWLRYLACCGEAFDFPQNAYQGDYVIEFAEQVKLQHSDKFVKPIAEVFADVPADEKDGGDKEKHIDALIANAKSLLAEHYQELHQLGLDFILDDIRRDLAEFGVEYQNWFSEKSLFDTDAVQHALEVLRKKNYLYEKDGATWFKSTEFGDEKDRVLARENGQLTYFAPDIAYHLNKLERGFSRVIDVLGADHHGYVPRLRAAIQALGANADALDVPLVQFVSLYRGKEKISMSTRGGSFVTLRELREEVGNDAARFFYIMRKVDQPMDFDLELAKSKSNENPVYYIQYAHARVCSVLRQLKEKQLAFDQAAGFENLNLLNNEYESRLLDLLSHYPELIANAAKHLDPQLLANYLRDLANAFHTYYNAEQFIVDDVALRNARLVLVMAVRQVIANALSVLGVSAPEEM